MISGDSSQAREAESQFKRKSFEDLRGNEILSVTHERFFNGKSKGLETVIGVYCGITDEHTFGNEFQLDLHIADDDCLRLLIDLSKIRSFRHIESHEIVKVLNSIRPFFDGLHG